MRAKPRIEAGPLADAMKRYAALPPFQVVTGVDKYSSITPELFPRYFAPYLLDTYHIDAVDLMHYELTTHTEKEFMAIIPKPEAQRTYFIVSLNGGLELQSGTFAKKIVREGQVVAMSNPVSRQVGVSARVRDFVGKPNVHIITVYPKQITEGLC